MPLQKTLDHILESWLPTKLTILITGSTILLTLLAIGLPEYLQKIDIILPPERKILLRIVAPISLLFLGTFIVLLLVVNHLKTLREIHSKEIADIKNLHQRETEKLGNKFIQNAGPLSSLSEQCVAILQLIAISENEYKKTAGYQDYYVLSEVTFHRNLEISPQKLRFLLEQLLSADCISRYPSGKFGGLKPKGRSLLNDKGLLP